MSFERFMKKFLNPVGNPEQDFYLKGTHEALNSYIEELEGRSRIPSLMVNGSVSTGVTKFPFVGSHGYFSPKCLRFSYNEIKTAMWCGNPELSFINLFNLIAKKVSQNFSSVSASPVITSPPIPVFLLTTVFNFYALELLSRVKIYGSNLTPELFLETQSDCIKKALLSCPPTTTLLSGIHAGGAFTGVMNVSYSFAG